MSKYWELMETLESLKHVMEDLVEVAQREQRHLIAFEPEALQSCNSERAELLDRQQELEVSIRAQMVRAREELDLEEADAPTLRKLARHISGKTQGALEDRCTCIEALAGTLRELHGMNALHAERGLKSVRGYLQVLTGAVKRSRGTTYTAAGRRRSETEGLATVQGSL